MSDDHGIMGCHSIQVVVLCVPHTGGQVSLHVLYLFRLTRLVRVFKMIAVSLPDTFLTPF